VAAPPAAGRDTRRWLTPALCALFFGSGFAALIYQVVWLRSFSLVFGVTVYAASTVLAGFMAGLAIGSYAAGRLGGRLRRPLVAFALAELGVGLTALLVPVAMRMLERGYLVLHPLLPESFAVVTAVRFVLAFAVLVVPTSLMGATLPLLVRAVGPTAGLGSTIAALYATNTAGAIAGALTAAFYLVPSLGLTRASMAAAMLNVLAAGAAVALAGRIGAPPPAAAASPPVATAGVDETTRRVVLTVFLVSGVSSLALEVIWFRVLILQLRPTAYAFAIMLAAVLCGISAGSYAVTPWLARRLPWLAVLSAIQLAVALVAVLSLSFQAGATWVQDGVAALLGAAGVNPYVWPLIGASLIAILPTALLLGAAFPIGLRLWVSDPSKASEQVSVFYALNVCGAIVGPLLAGFLLLPWLGSRSALIAVSALALLNSLALASRLWSSWPNAAGFLTLVGPVAFVMASLNAAGPFEAGRGLGSERLLWVAEGVQTTVSVVQRRTGERVLYLNGTHQAGDAPGTAFTHHRIGALPMMIHPDPRRVLVVGLGGGATAGAAARFPGAQVDVIELSSDVVRAAPFFGAVNFDLLTRPNVHMRVDDARNFLLTTRRKYDVVMADLIIPIHAGSAAVYSVEYFELVRRALAPEGVVMQWIVADSAFEYRLLLRTFLSVFPETTAWAEGSLVAGRLTPLQFSASRFEQRRQDAAFRSVFDWDLATIRRLYFAGPDLLRAVAGDGPLLTDDRPLIEYFLSLPRNDPGFDPTTVQGPFEDVLVP
jgi:spermidine synthase